MQTNSIHCSVRRTSQRGVLLIVVLIMLMVLSILASVSIRGASSSEQVANQGRLTNLGQQAAEAALRFCEEQVQLNVIDGTQGFTPAAAPVGAGVKYYWEAGAGPAGQPSMSNWDEIDVAKNPFVGTGILKTLTPAQFKASGDTATITYFQRMPQCMSQYLTTGDNKTFVTTARGFGPEVIDTKDGTTPQGAEVWLQSVLTMK